MKTALKYIGLTMAYTFIFAIKFLRAFLKMAFSPAVMKGMREGERQMELKRIFRAKNFNPLFRPDNPSNPIKKARGW
jgi:hypothetical protein